MDSRTGPVLLIRGLLCHTNMGKGLENPVHFSGFKIQSSCKFAAPDRPAAETEGLQDFNTMNKTLIRLGRQLHVANIATLLEKVKDFV